MLAAWGHYRSVTPSRDTPSRQTGTLDDILATEERIATRVSESLSVELSGEDRARLARGGTSSPEAHRHYLKGRHHIDRHIVALNSDQQLPAQAENYTNGWHVHIC